MIKTTKASNYTKKKIHSKYTVGRGNDTVSRSHRCETALLRVYNDNIIIMIRLLLLVEVLILFLINI